MDFQLEDMMDWFESNKDWLLVPLSIAIAIEVIGFVLLIMFGGGVGIFLKVVVILLLLVSPFIGYLLGEFVDPYVAPLLDSLKK